MNKLKNRSPHVMSVCLPTDPPTYLPIYLSTHQSIYLYPSIHTLTHPSIYLRVYYILGMLPMIQFRGLCSYLLSKNVKINIFIIQNTFQNSITSMGHAVKTVWLTFIYTAQKIWKCPFSKNKWPIQYCHLISPAVLHIMHHCSIPLHVIY
jgi:hypothetical protein